MGPMIVRKKRELQRYAKITTALQCLVAKCWRITKTSVTLLFQVRSNEISREREEQNNADQTNLTGATVGSKIRSVLSVQ